MSIHGNEDAANAMGVNTAAFKLKIFMMSAMLAALAGFLFAHHGKTINVDSANLMLSVSFVAWVAVGGMSNIWGTLVATVLLVLLPEFLRAFQELEMLIYGLVIVVIMILMPNGLFRGVSDFTILLKSKLFPGSEPAGDADHS